MAATPVPWTKLRTHRLQKAEHARVTRTPATACASRQCPTALQSALCCGTFRLRHRSPIGLSLAFLLRLKPPLDPDLPQV